MRELHAWENGHHVGVFSEDDEERISFAYDANEGLPISLSLPRTGGWRDQAPRNFLDNLLPDNPNVRKRVAERVAAAMVVTGIDPRIGELDEGVAVEQQIGAGGG